MDEVHLSPEARQRLEDELEWRSGVRRKEISAWLERAREHGDIRENADYDAAKNDQGHNEARVRQLEDMLRRAVQVEGTTATSWPRARWSRSGSRATTPRRRTWSGRSRSSTTTYEVLSTGSPLGQALIGHSPGEVVTYDGAAARRCRSRS